MKIWVELGITWFFLCIQLESLEIRQTDEEGTPEKMREDVRPGSPYIVFSVKPTVEVVLDNPQQRSSLFRIKISIADAETTATFTDKVAKTIGLKGL